MTSENPQNTITVEDRIGKYSPELQKTKHGLILQAAADAIRDRYHITCNPEQTAEILRLFFDDSLDRAETEAEYAKCFPEMPGLFATIYQYFDTVFGNKSGQN